MSPVPFFGLCVCMSVHHTFCTINLFLDWDMSNIVFLYQNSNFYICYRLFVFIARVILCFQDIFHFVENHFGAPIAKSKDHNVQLDVSDVFIMFFITLSLMSIKLLFDDAKSLCLNLKVNALFPPLYTVFSLLLESVGPAYFFEYRYQENILIC